MILMLCVQGFGRGRWVTREKFIGRIGMHYVDPKRKEEWVFVT